VPVSDRSAVILHVEDEAPNRALLRAVMSRAADPNVRDATIVDAPDLATARAALTSGPVDLVLLDVRLPDGNGLDLARAIRDGDEPRPPIIVMSASVLPDEQDAALATGARHFLSKPYAPSELVALVIATLRSPESA
jgi:two-component system KDP operon response regulator KdpE